MNDRTASIESARNPRRRTWTDTGPIRRACYATEEETARARELGSAAYDRKAERAPLLDGEFVGLLGAPPVGEPRKINLLTAWQDAYAERVDAAAAAIVEADSVVSDRHADWRADFARDVGREPTQTERMAAYGYLMREHDAQLRRRASA